MTLFLLILFLSLQVLLLELRKNLQTIKILNRFLSIFFVWVIFLFNKILWLTIFIRSASNIFLISQTFFWLLRLMSDISSISGASGSTNSKIEICRILVILILSGRSSLYVTSSRTFKILKGFSLAKSNLLLNLIVWINIVFVLGILYRRYTLFFFFKSWSSNSLIIDTFLYYFIEEH